MSCIGDLWVLNLKIWLALLFVGSELVCVFLMNSCYETIKYHVVKLINKLNYRFNYVVWLLCEILAPFATITPFLTLLVLETFKLNPFFALEAFQWYFSELHFNKKLYKPYKWNFK